jgi:hypothetical protein
MCNYRVSARHLVCADKLTLTRLTMKEKESLVNSIQFSHINNCVTVVPTEEDMAFENKITSRTLNK